MISGIKVNWSSKQTCSDSASL